MVKLLRGENLKLLVPVPLTLHPAAVYLNSLSKGSRRTMGNSLNEIARLLTDGECDAYSLDWSKLRYQHTAAVRAALADRLAATTVNKMLSALRGILKEAYRLDLIDERDYRKASDISNLKESGRLRGRTLSGQEIRALLANCQQEGTPASCRDTAAIAIFRSSGIRREELTQLKLNDVDLQTGKIEIRRGKGGKYRLVYLNKIALELVKAWVETRGKKPGALICPVNKGGTVIIRHFAANGDGIYKLIKQRAMKAGIKHFSPHDFRRTFCTELLDEEDTLTVQDLAGHSSANTTARYDRRGETRKRLAVEKLQF
jgi:integrase/recombinase XerD